jgi:hypothetical protein
MSCAVVALPVYASAVIDGHAVTLEVYRDGDTLDVVSHCYIERGCFSASLECADATGELENFRGTACAIHPATLTRVRAWAERLGY